MKHLKQIFKFFGGATMFFIVSASFVACSSDGPAKDDDKLLPPTKRKEITLTQQATKASHEIQPFYLNFTKDAIEYVDNNADIKVKNVVVSPLSASSLLGMIANGMEAPQANILTEYLGCEELESLNDLAETLLKNLPEADNQSKFILANALWINQDISLSSQFASTMSDQYKAEIFYDNFNNSKALFDKINKWGSLQTDGMIPNSLKEIKASSVAVLLNTMLFKSKWAKENMFPQENTKKVPFVGLKGKKDVNMMKSKEYSADITMTENFTGCAISFGNEQFNLFLILPNENLTLQEADKLLTLEELNTLRHNSYPCMLTVSLPKFKIENYFSINEILKAGGITILDMENILPMFNPEIAGVITSNQSTAFELDETGVKAAAVTDGDISLESPSFPDEKIELTFNRPFYFFITEYSTQACLLSGRITDL